MAKGYSFLIVVMFFLTLHTAIGQNWSTIGGTSMRNGMSRSFGPEDVSVPSWNITDAGPTVWGNAIFSLHDRFATSRVQLSPVYHVTVECRSLTDGSLLWEKSLGEESKLYVVGMTEDAVYVHDYNSDSLYAFSPVNGQQRWVCPEKTMIFGGAHGILFTCDGDPVVNGPELYEKSLMRLDRNTGQVKWYNTNFVSVGPAPDFCIFGDRLYKWVGAINLPTKLAAIDLNSGETLFYSDEIPGEALQEMPLTAGPDGIIYGQRDGGILWAIKDEGSSFAVKWTYTPAIQGMGTYGNIGVGPDRTIYFSDGCYIRRLDPETGALLNSSVQLCTDLMTGTYIVTDRNGTVYVSNAKASEGKYFAFSPDLQTEYWTRSVPYNYYAGQQIGKEGMFVMAGSGTSIKGFKTAQPHPPCAWFVADTNTIGEGSSVLFSDQSSFGPETWEWTFEGGSPQSSTEQNPGPIMYATPGTYPVTLVTANPLGTDTATRLCYIHVEEVTFVNRAEVRQDIKIYPNPCDGQFTFSTPARVPKTTRIVVTDMHGRLIFESEKQLEGRTIDLRGIVSRGLYFIHCVSDNTTYSGKLIIR